MSAPLPALERISAVLEPHGILMRGVVNFSDGGGPSLADGSRALSVVLLGNAGGSVWPAFSRWRETYDEPDPLDTWSKQLIRPLAEEVGACAYFPSDPPWQPFQQWAMRAEGLKPSPLGILIHPRYGLWHGYRGALGFPFAIEIPAIPTDHPCDRCAAKPCLTTCLVGAISVRGPDISACREYLVVEKGRETCMLSGCLARNVCPVGAAYRYPTDQLRFHMQALF